jgi:hypothetical protein
MNKAVGEEFWTVVQMLNQSLEKHADNIEEP